MKKKLILATAANALLVIFEIPGLVISIKDWGLDMFQFYTQNSNYFALAVSVLYVITALRRLIRGGPMPEWIAQLRYIATCCLTLTFLIVLFVLIPMGGLSNVGIMMLFSGSVLYHHLLCPILSVASFLLLESGAAPDRKMIGAAMVPTLTYAVVIIILNLARTVRGPYPFLYLYEQPVWVSALWLLIIIGAAYLIAAFLRRWKQNCCQEISD